MKTKQQAQASKEAPVTVNATTNLSEEDQDFLRAKHQEKEKVVPVTEEKPKEEKKAEPVKEETPEELALNKKRFLFQMGYGENPDAEADAIAKAEKEKVEAKAREEKKEPEKTEEKEPEAKVEETKVEEAKVEEQPKPEKPKRKRKVTIPDEEEAVDIEDVATRAAEKALQSQAQPQPQPQPQVQPENPETNLPDSYQWDLAVVRQMEKGNPAYRGLSDQLLKWYDREASYVSAWEKENPGKTFDAKASEHEDFYANEPPIDADAFEMAKVQVIEERAVAAGSGRTAGKGKGSRT